MIETLTADRITRARFAYSVRRVPRTAMRSLVTSGLPPRPGDLVLARVDEIGKHGGLEQATSRRATLFPGDEIVVAYGSRYAPDQFEAIVPDDLGPCHLVAAGGLAGRVVSAHGGIAEPPTAITPMGLIAGPQGEILSTRDGALPQGPMPLTDIPVIAVVGTSMNAGKTTTAATLVHGLARTGLRVGATKVTGTGAGKDLWLMRDAGAMAAYDFTDAGHASTAGLGQDEIETIARTIIARLTLDGADVIVMEVADGLLQRETSALLRSAFWRRRVGAMLFAAGDAMGAIAGASWLRDHGLPLVAVSGALTQSPLAMREAAAGVDVPVLDLAGLLDPDVVTRVLPVGVAA